jgi:hypothetical protein
MGVRLSMTVRNAVLVEKRFEDFAGEVKKVGAGRLRGRLESARKMVSTYPALYAGEPPHHWASEKQRRYVMWAISTGNLKVPYQRTGKYGDSWQIIKLPDGNGYMLRSNYPAAKFIAGNAYGQMQYHLHQGRWMTLRAAMETAVEGLPQDIQENISMVARRTGMK